MERPFLHDSRLLCRFRTELRLIYFIRRKDQSVKLVIRQVLHFSAPEILPAAISHRLVLTFHD